MTEKKSSFEWEQGYDAGLAGQNDSDNPYIIGSDEAMDWEDGRSQTEQE